MTKFSTILLLTLTLSSIVLAPEPKPKKKVRTCRFAQLFGADGFDVPREHTHKNFCSSIKKTCCSNKDFLQLQNWWENSFDKISVVEQRLIEMKTLLGRFRKMPEYIEEVWIRVKRVKQHKKTGQPACVSPAHVLGKVFELGLIKTAIKSYEFSSEQCWKHTKSLVNGLMCSVCDADQQDMFETDKKKVIISNGECLKFTQKCLGHMKSIWALTHYMTFMNMMSKCNDSAQFKGLHEEVMMSDFELRAINSCLHAKNLDDCAQVCRSQMSFSTQVKFEHDNVAKVMGFLRNIDKEFGPLAKKKRIENDKKEAEKKKKEEAEKKKESEKKTEKKIRILDEEWKKYNEMMEREDEVLKIAMGLFKHDRILKDDPKKDDPSEQEKNKYRTDQVDELGVIVKKKGLDLSKYTDKEADKFEPMNLELIFGKFALINSVVSLITLVVYFL